MRGVAVGKSCVDKAIGRSCNRQSSLRIPATSAEAAIIDLLLDLAFLFDRALTSKKFY